MNVDLRPELEQLIERKLATGHYADRGSVIEEALELMREQDNAMVELREALTAAHRRNADLNPEEAEALVEDAVRKHRQSQQH